MLILSSLHIKKKELEDHGKINIVFKERPKGNYSIDKVVSKENMTSLSSLVSNRQMSITMPNS